MKICDGCGTARSLNDIMANNPKALSCCPERRMRDLTVPEYEALRALQQEVQNMINDRRKEERHGWALNTPWFQDWFRKIERVLTGS